MEYGPYEGTVLSVTDGDTARMDLVRELAPVDVGFGVHVRPAALIDGRLWSCRLYGVNAPELKSPTLEAGRAAKAYLEQLLPLGSRVTVVSVGWDKYGGRYDGRITLADGRDVAQAMVDAGHAVPKNYGLPPGR